MSFDALQNHVVQFYNEISVIVLEKSKGIKEQYPILSQVDVRIGVAVLALISLFTAPGATIIGGIAGFVGVKKYPDLLKSVKTIENMPTEVKVVAAVVAALLLYTYASLLLPMGIGIAAGVLLSSFNDRIKNKTAVKAEAPPVKEEEPAAPVDENKDSPVDEMKDIPVDENKGHPECNDENAVELHSELPSESPEGVQVDKAEFDIPPAVKHEADNLEGQDPMAVLSKPEEILSEEPKVIPDEPKVIPDELSLFEKFQAAIDLVMPVIVEDPAVLPKPEEVLSESPKVKRRNLNKILEESIAFHAGLAAVKKEIPSPVEIPLQSDKGLGELKDKFPVVLTASLQGRVSLEQKKNPILDQEPAVELPSKNALPIPAVEVPKPEVLVKMQAPSPLKSSKINVEKPAQENLLGIGLNYASYFRQWLAGDPDDLEV